MRDHQAQLVAVGPVHDAATPTSTTTAKASRFIPALSYPTGHRLVPALTSLTSSSTAIGARPHLPPPASQRTMKVTISGWNTRACFSDRS
jgi:hypothetical protein